MGLRGEVLFRRTGRDFFMTSEKPFFIERQTVRMDGKNVTASGDGDYVIKVSDGIPVVWNRGHSQYMRDINSARCCYESNLSQTESHE